MKHVTLTFIAFLLTCVSGYAQTVFWSDDFEDVGSPSSGTRIPETNTGSGDIYFKKTDGTGIATVSPFTGKNGTYFWAGEDHGDVTPPTGQFELQIEFNNINITGLTNLQFTGKFAANSSAVWESLAFASHDDYIIVEYSINNNPTYTPIIRFYGNNGVNKQLMEETSGDNVGEGALLTHALTEYTKNIPATGTEIDIRIRVYTNGTNEEWAIDNFRLLHTPSCTAPTIGVQPQSANVCRGANRTFSVSGVSNATAYQWQFLNAGVWTNLANDATYSGVTGTTLTITNAQTSLNNVQYRVIAINGVASCFTNSNPATLTVTNITGATANSTPSCSGSCDAAAAAQGSGGTPNNSTDYTYAWSNGATGSVITGLCAGSYTVAITHTATGCQYSPPSITITNPAAYTVSTSKTDVACFGASTGSATVFVTAGPGGPYTYSWSPSGGTNATANNLAAGTYTVTITSAAGCQTTRTFTINQPAAVLGGTISKTDVSCNGGSNGTATVAATGGTAPYFYSWSPSGGTNATASGLSSGTYTVTVTDDNSCQITRTITVNQPVALGGTISKTDVSCNGGSNGTATVAVTGGTTPYAYSWSPSGGTNATASGLANGTYTVTVTDNNSCQITRTVTVNQPAAALGGTISKTDVSCNGGSNGTATVAATGGTAPYFYSWSPSGGTNATASGLANGTYTVTVTDNNGCQITRTITVNQPAAALGGTASKTDVSCFGGSNGTATVAATGGTTPYFYSWSPSGGTNATASGLSSGTYTVTVTDNNSCQITRTVTVNQPAASLAGTTSKTDVSCFGGSNGTATVAVSGGTAPYFYSWSPSGGTNATASGLSSGTYTVTVTDNNSCQITRTVTVNQPAAALGGTISKTDVSCFGGSNGTATVAATGGTAPYFYSWSPSGGTNATASGLANGTYTVTVTDNNSCQITRTITVNQPAAALDGTISKTDVSCNGGSNGTATIAATGGTTPYAYSWSPSGGTNATASGLGAGTYTVTVTDNNACEITRTITVDEPTALTATTSQTDLLCNGAATGSASVTVSGGTGSYSYSWSPSGGTAATASGLTAGTYTVTITDDNSCQITQTFTIAEPAALDITPSQTDILCNGDANGTAMATVSGGTGSYDYSWSPSGGTAATASGLAAGTYTVTVTDENLCQATQSYTIAEPAALTAATAQTDLSCNGGSNGTATVTVSGGTGSYDYSWSPSGGTGATASGLTAGTYTVTITDENNCQITRTFTLTEPAALAATGSQTDIICNGAASATATVNVTGGTGSYDYSWSPSGGTAATASGLAAGTYTVTVTDENLCELTHTFTITEPSALSLTPTHTNVSCNGGSDGTATVAVTGGTPDYTYSWAPTGGNGASASGLTAGTYIFTVADANDCQTTQTIIITEPTALSVTPSQTDVSCNGGSNGSATVSVSGGTPDYTYSWSPSGGTGATASGLAAGTYTVTITDDNGCETTQTFTITEPAALDITPEQTDILCNGGSDGSASVTVTGGTPDYAYNWSPSGGTAATATGLTAGTYTVTVTDENGCEATQSFTLTEPTALDVVATQTDILCNGDTTGTASVAVTGGTPDYTYSWSPEGGTDSTASNLSAGTYTVTITDGNGCEETASFTITEPAALSLTAGTQTNVSCNGYNDGGASIAVTGGTADYTYEWTPSGATEDTVTTLEAGDNIVYVTDANGCVDSLTFTITEPDGMTITAEQTNVSCFGENDGSASIDVTGGAGNYTYEWDPSGSTNDTITELVAGIYVVTVTDDEGCEKDHSITITQPDAITFTQTAALCEGESITVGGNTYSTPGTYLDTLSAVNSCDSIVTTIVTVTTPDLSTSVDANVITAGQDGATYQWIDCDSNEPVSGAASQVFAPVANGSYAVIVTLNSCSDTSDCVDITTIGIDEIAGWNATLYPNPSNGNVTVDWGIALSDVTIEVTDVAGKAVYVKEHLFGSSQQLELEQPRGIYYVRVSNGEQQVVLKLVLND